MTADLGGAEPRGHGAVPARGRAAHRRRGDRPGGWMSTRYAGIAWTDAGYRVEVLDGAGRRVVEPSSWGGAQVAELIAWLRDSRRRQVPAVVLESTNGLLDGLDDGGRSGRVPPGSLAAAAPPAVRLRPGRTAGGSRPESSPARWPRVTCRGRYADRPRRGVLRRRTARRADRGGADRGRRCFEHGRRDTPRVALTFDDGPDPVHAPAGAGDPGPLRRPGDLLLRRPPCRGAVRRGCAGSPRPATNWATTPGRTPTCRI